MVNCQGQCSRVWYSWSSWLSEIKQDKSPVTLLCVQQYQIWGKFSIWILIFAKKWGKNISVLVYYKCLHLVFSCYLGNNTFSWYYSNSIALMTRYRKIRNRQSYKFYLPALRFLNSQYPTDSVVLYACICFKHPCSLYGVVGIFLDALCALSSQKNSLQDWKAYLGTKWLWNIPH